MKPKSLYLVLCVVGTVLPYSQFVPFLREHGLDFRLFFEQLFSNRIGGFFGLDVIVSSVVLWALVVIDGRRAGVSTFGLPLLLTWRSECLWGCRCFSTCARGGWSVQPGPACVPRFDPRLPPNSSSLLTPLFYRKSAGTPARTILLQSGLPIGY